MPAKIHYYDIGDYKTREEKLEILRNFKSIENVPWTSITPNERGDWINQRGEEFQKFIGIDEIFEIHSRGAETGRDAWVYNFSKKKLAEKMRQMIAFYNEQVEQYMERISWDKELNVDDFISFDTTKISWSSSLTSFFKRKIKSQFKKEHIVPAIYRPFCKQWTYFAVHWTHRTYQLPRIFPTPETENEAIGVLGRGATVPFCTLMTKCLPDLELVSKAQWFPYWIYDKATGERRENITDAALKKFRTHYEDKKMTKRDVFYYIYGLLHSTEYRERWGSELKKGLPRIPFSPSFRDFAEKGKALADLHVNYETGEKYPLGRNKLIFNDYRVKKMKFASKEDTSRLIYNTEVVLSEIPEAAHRYVVNGRSALGWLLERYQSRHDKASNIANDPNDWLFEDGTLPAGEGRYLLDLIERVVYLSVESVKIIEALPPLGV